MGLACFLNWIFDDCVWDQSERFAFVCSILFEIKVGQNRFSTWYRKIQAKYLDSSHIHVNSCVLQDCSLQGLPVNPIRYIYIFHICHFSKSLDDLFMSYIFAIFSQEKECRNEYQIHYLLFTHPIKISLNIDARKFTHIC